MEYFYTPPDRVAATSLIIDGEEFAHLTHVMRRAEGDTIRVVDGAGQAYEAIIESIDRGSVRCSITQRLGTLHEPDVHLTMAVALLKNGSSYDFCIEKCTEIGVSEFVPLITARTIPRHARIDRWQKLALAAMKQSGRSVLPTVRPPLSFADYLAHPTAGAQGIIPHEKVERPLLAEGVLHATKRVAACIGPEGGFTDEEVSAAEAAGWNPVSLGRRRLRAETAAITTAALVLLHA
jgi:16S rRNA (uracil1498-N3)-methyltransferase